MTNYAEINKSKLQNRDKGIYTIPETLLNTEKVLNKIGSDELLKIFCDKRRQFIEKIYHYSDALQDDLKTKNYRWCRVSDNDPDQTYLPFPIKP
jgi:hypothetical protein